MSFNDNPFFLLGVSPRDSKRVLHDKAENKSFDLPEDECRKAEQTLLNPKKRLEAEIAWFPGLSPKLINQIIEFFNTDEFNFELFEQLDGLPKCNYLALFLNKFSDKGLWDQATAEKFIRIFCDSVNNIDPVLTLKLINNDRIAAGFPEISSELGITSDLEKLQVYYKKILHDFLKSFEISDIADILTSIIEDITNNGEDECEWMLLDDIITDYEIDIIPAFEELEEKINNNILNIIEEMKKGENGQLQNKFNCLKRNVLQWDHIAQPIQVLLRTKGVDHKRSEDLSKYLREIALLAHNVYDCTDLSIKITDLQQTVFAELRQASETAADDKKQLLDIIKQKEEIENEPPYFCEWGWFFKKQIKMDYNSIILNGAKKYNYSDINGILWGATRNSVNGIPVGTTYNVSLKIGNADVSVPIKDSNAYDEITQRLWVHVGFPLLLNMLNQLKQGNYITFGGMKVYNDGMELTSNKWFSSEKKKIDFSLIRSVSAYNGSLIVQTFDNSFSAEFGFQSVYNTHILYALLKTVLNENRKRTITEAFNVE